MKKLVKIHRSMINRLNEVNALRTPSELRDWNKRVKHFIEFPEKPVKGFFCDRCMGSAVEILTEEVWTIPYFQMVVCEACAEEIKVGGDALIAGYFIGADSLLKTLLTKEEITQATQKGPKSTLENIILPNRDRWEKNKTGKSWPVDIIFNIIWDAMAALTEEKAKLEKWRTFEI